MTASFLGLLLPFLFGWATADRPPLPNQFCPVMPDEPAVEGYEAVYQGRRVFFCCADCVRRFKADPAAYAGNLPPPPPRRALPDEGWADVALRWAVPVLEAVGRNERYQYLVAYLVGVFLLAGIARRKLRRAARAGRPLTRAERLAAPFARPHTVLTLVLAGTCVQLAAGRDAPPVRGPGSVPDAVPEPPAKYFQFAWPHALHALPRGLSNTYYRGNDERNARLFNGGRYRTATFHVSVRVAGGGELAAGRTADGPLTIHCRLVRAANTAAAFYTPTAIGAYRFHNGGQPIPADGGQRLTTVREDWEWEAAGPIGVPTLKGYEGFRGVWLLSADGTGTAPHYAVPYAVHLRDGVVQPESVVWMTAVYPSPILDGPTADGEWFSDQPFPEIPDGQAATDRKLLGLDRPDGTPQKGKKK